MTKDEIRELAALLKSAIDPEWLTESQVCQRLQVSDNWVRDNRSKLGARLVPGSKKGWRYNRGAVDSCLINPFQGL